MTQVIRTRTLLGTRPADVPSDWLIFHAPRPIYGHKEWRDGGGMGFFYAAVDPDGDRADWMAEQNRRNDAVILEYIDEEDAFAANRARLIAGRGDDVAPLLDEPDNRDWVVSSYIVYLNDQHERDARNEEA
jgi:hypothetical protein